MSRRLAIAVFLWGCQPILGIEPLSGDGGSGGTGGSSACGELTDCGGTCVDTKTSPDHCGACDHACLGEACGGYVCTPKELSFGLSANDVAVDGGFAYVTDGAAGNITRIDTATLEVKLLYANQTSCFHVGVGAGEVYWSVPSLVRHAPADGSGLPLDAGFAEPLDLAVHKDRAIWSTPAGVDFFSPSLGLLATQPAGQGPQGVAVNDTGALWARPLDGDVSLGALDGLSGGALYKFLPSPPTWVALWDKFVFFSDSQGVQEGRIDATPLASVWTNPDVVTSMWADEVGVYWTTESGRVLERRHADASAFDIGFGGGSRGVTTDATYVYWVADNKLLRVPK